MKQHIKLADQVIFRLQQDISLGKYKEGDLIPPEPVLMEQFGVGRSTIREAIKTLSNAGVLKVQQGAGTFVCAPEETAEPLAQRLRRAAQREVQAVRSLLEAEIVQLAAVHRSAKDLAAMRRELDRRRDAIAQKNYNAAADADIAFHQAVAIASGNSVLADLYQTFTTVIKASFRQRGKPDAAQFQATHQLHLELLKAIEARQPDKAAKTVKQILTHQF